MDLIKEQIKLEQEQIMLGRDRFYNSINKSRQKSNEVNTIYGQKILRISLDILANKILQFFRKAEGAPGPKHHASAYLKRLDPKISAFIALKGCLNRMTYDYKLARVSQDIGRGIENEVRFRKFKGTAPRLYAKVKKQVEKATTYRHKSTVMIHTINKFEIDTDWEPWSTKIKAKVGLTLVLMIVQELKFFNIVVKRRGRKSLKILAPTQLCRDFVERIQNANEVLNPDFLPTVVVPKPWEGAIGGGYYTKAVPPLRLVKKVGRKFLEEIHGRINNIPGVLGALNAIQETPWAINQNVLEVMQYFWDKDSGEAGLPRQEDIPLPPRPPDIDTNKDSLRNWKRRAAQVYDKRRSQFSKRLQAIKILGLAQKFRKYPAIYFPHQLDFRGRCYPVPSFLTPQGADPARGLLTFACSKKIMTKEQANALAIHGCNCFGKDKLSLDERINFINKIEAELRIWAENPIDHTGWAEASNPWQFLAFVFEWVGFLDTGYGYPSSLPICVDGSNNGLQNFAAMLKDSGSGKSVNLIPGEKPHDIYQEIADLVTNNLSRDSSDAAAKWLEFGIDRRLLKRPTMVYFYGGTQFSCRQYLEDVLIERVGAGEKDFWGGNYFEATVFLAKHVMDAIASTAVAAKDTMAWLHEIVKITNKTGIPVQWTTPLGFPVVQAYKNLKLNEIRTTLGEKVRIYITNYSSGKLDTRRQVNAIAPNFVHSMDATHLFMTVNKGLDRGLSSFAMIHDSFGTHAANMRTLNHSLREAFVELYKNNVLDNFRSEISNSLPGGIFLPLPPRKGKLNLNKVMASEYFFA